MRTWHSFKPIVWIFLIMSAVLLVLAGMVSQGWTKQIVPPPETTASQLVGALAAHRFEGAMNQLSQDLQQQVTEEDLRALMSAIEQSPSKGIQDSHGQSAQIEGDQATAEVQVKLGTNEQINIQFPLKKENGVWKVTSLDPLGGFANP